MGRIRLTLLDIILYAADACFWLAAVCFRLSAWCKRTGRKMREQRHD